MEYTWVTPQKGKVALFRFGQWIEIYPNEVVLVHKSHIEDLKIYKLVPTKEGQKVFKTIKELKNSKWGKRLHFTE